MFDWGVVRLLAVASLAIVAACSGRTLDSFEDDPPTPIQAGSPPAPTGRAGAGGASPIVAGSGGTSGTGTTAGTAGSAGSTPVMFQELQIQPKTALLLVGGKATVTVWALDANGLKVDVTQRAMPTSSDVSVATLQGKVLTAVSPGQTTVNARLGELSASAVFTVEDTELTTLEVIAFQPSCGPAQSLRFDARGKLKDGSTRVVTDQVEWSISEPTRMASLGDGLALCVSAGTVDVHAKLGTLAASLGFEITGPHATELTLGPSNFTRLGWTDILQLRASYDDGSNVDYTSWASFESDHPEVVRLASNVVYAEGNGNTTISAKLGATTFASTTWRVSDAAVKALQITPGKVEVVYPATGRLVATGTLGDGTTANVSRFVEWSQNQCVSVSGGELTAISVCSETVTAKLDGVEASAQVTVSAGKPDVLTVGDDLTLPAGISYHLWATGYYDNVGTLDVSQEVTWTSSDPSVAAFPDPKRPWIVGKKPGTTVISATLGALASNTHTVTISEAQLSSVRFGSWGAQLPLDQRSDISVMGSFDDFNEYDVTASATWQIGNPAILRIETNQFGAATVVPLIKGKTTITATVDGASVTGSVTVVAGG